MERAVSIHSAIGTDPVLLGLLERLCATSAESTRTSTSHSLPSTRERQRFVTTMSPTDGEGAGNGGIPDLLGLGTRLPPRQACTASQTLPNPSAPVIRRSPEFAHATNSATTPPTTSSASSWSKPPRAPRCSLPLSPFAKACLFAVSDLLLTSHDSRCERAVATSPHRALLSSLSLCWALATARCLRSRESWTHRSRSSKRPRQSAEIDTAPAPAGWTGFARLRQSR